MQAFGYQTPVFFCSEVFFFSFFFFSFQRTECGASGGRDEWVSHMKTCGFLFELGWRFFFVFRVGVGVGAAIAMVGADVEPS